MGELDSPALAIVAEKPEENEDREGEPLVGKTGKVVEKACGGWDSIFRTNVRKCLCADKTPQDKAASIEHCVKAYLIPELDRVKARARLALGADAAGVLVNRKDVSSISGSFYTRAEVESMLNLNWGNSYEEDLS